MSTVFNDDYDDVDDVEMTPTINDTSTLTVNTLFMQHISSSLHPFKCKTVH